MKYKIALLVTLFVISILAVQQNIWTANAIILRVVDKDSVSLDAGTLDKIPLQMEALQSILSNTLKKRQKSQKDKGTEPQTVKDKVPVQKEIPYEQIMEVVEEEVEGQADQESAEKDQEESKLQEEVEEESNQEEEQALEDDKDGEGDSRKGSSDGIQVIISEEDPKQVAQPNGKKMEEKTIRYSSSKTQSFQTKEQKQFQQVRKWVQKVTLQKDVQPNSLVQIPTKTIIASERSHYNAPNVKNVLGHIICLLHKDQCPNHNIGEKQIIDNQLLSLEEDTHYIINELKYTRSKRQNQRKEESELINIWGEIFQRYQSS